MKGTEEGTIELRDNAEEKTGPCPVCNKRHEYQRNTPRGPLPWPSDRLQECNAIQALTPQQREKVSQKLGGGGVCVSRVYTEVQCNRIRHHQKAGPSIGCQEKEG